MASFLLVSLKYGSKIVHYINLFSPTNSTPTSVPSVEELHTPPFPSAAMPVKSKPRDRLAIVPYLPAKSSQVNQFLMMLFGSWKFIIDHQQELFPEKNLHEINDIDMLAFCHPKICNQTYSFCTPIKHLSEIKPVNYVSRCYAIEQNFETDIPYTPLNSFIMFNRTDITELIPKYKYMLRTDNDVFITPAMYTLKPTWFLHGNGGYGHVFNGKRLEEIAARLGLTHRKRHAIGSTWCGDTQFFIKAGRLTLETTRHVFLHEFQPNATGLESINFKANREGEWPKWWRPVSLLYGGDIALNHLITDFSDKNKGEFDSSSCDKISIWKTPHIHCWHSNCEFHKFKFMEYLNKIIESRDKIPGDVVHRMVVNSYPHNISDMSLHEYATYIAWSSVTKYLKEKLIK